VTKGFLSTLKTHPLALILSLFFGLQLFHILLVPVWGSSEAREAHVIWSILHGDHFFYPSRNGIVPSKPPLFHWIGTFVGFCFQSSSIWIPRLVSLLSSIGVLFLTFSLTKIYSKKSEESEIEQNSTAYLAVVILLTSWIFFAQTVDAKVDMLLCFWIIAATYVGTSALFTKKLSIITGFLCSLLSAAAILTKGPLAVVIIALFGLITFFEQQEKSWKIFFQLIGYSIVGVCLASVWYLLGVSNDGFIERHLFLENITRLIGSEKMNKEAPWFYLISVQRTFFPWIFVLYFLLYKKQKRHVGIDCFFVLLLLLSLAAGKRHSYILPAAPLFACGLAVMLTKAKYFNSKIFEKYQKSFLICLVGIILLTTSGMYIKAISRNYPLLASSLAQHTKDQQIVVVKEWWDESFDVVLYLLQKRVVVLTPDAFPEFRKNHPLDQSYCLVNNPLTNMFQKESPVAQWEKPTKIFLFRCSSATES
jgi:4-amino-4-deoxy-L-arabinose transferase-like glycosyltransferase